MTEEEREKLFPVQVEVEGCGHGKRFYVIRPDDSAGSTSYEDAEPAEDERALLLEGYDWAVKAYRAERDSLLRKAACFVAMAENSFTLGECADGRWFCSGHQGATPEEAVLAAKKSLEGR